MHVGGFHAVPGRCRGLEGLAGASKGSRGLQGPPGAFGQSRDFEGPQMRAWARLKFHAGWLGWTRHPPWQGGGGGQEACVQGGVEGSF